MQKLTHRRLKAVLNYLNILKLFLNVFFVNGDK
jgi:hypothetical protein